MSFTEQVKHELIRIDDKKLPLRLAELAGIMKVNGSISIKNGNLAVNIGVFYGDLARKICSLLKDEFDLSLEIVVSRHNHFSRHHQYEIKITPQDGVRDFLIRLGFMDEDTGTPIFAGNGNFVNNVRQQKAYIRGVFLGAGSVNSPGSEYHLEFRTEYRSRAEEIIELLENFALEGHLIEHKGKSVIYFKSYEDITTILTIIGAHKSLLKMENARIVKDVKNDVNRRVNCETANLDKTIKASMDQLENIHFIEQNLGLDNIAQGLREIANLRKQNPYASLKELGQLLDPPLSKSGVNHRLRRIDKLATRLRGEK